MKRSLLAALLAVLLLVGAGLRLQSYMEDPGPAMPAAENASTPPQPNPSLAIAPNPAAAETQPLTAEVLTVRGGAEARRFEGQQWTPLAPGDQLNESAVLRTTQGALVLGIGEGTRVSVSPNSQFRLRQLSNNLSRVRLEGGHVTASVRGGLDSELAVEVLGTDTTATLRDAEASILRSPNATVTVASRRGEVAVRGARAEVKLDEGQQSVTEAGKKPGRATKIPSSLFLKLRGSQDRKLRTRSTRVHGTTTPGTVVVVNGVETTAVDGRFVVDVPLQEGENRLVVVAHDVMGRRQSQRLRGPLVDSTPPPVQGKVEW